MLVQVPRLTSSLREPFDVDQAYLQRKLILQNHKPRQSSTSVDESELARKIVHRWEEASYEVRQAYKQFIGAVVELIDGEVHPEEFREMALAVYCLFGRPEEEDYAEANIAGKKQEVQMHLGHTVSDANMQKVASLAQRLSGMQSSDHGITLVSERPVNGTHDNAELVQNTFEDLEDSGCIKMSKDSVEPMMLEMVKTSSELKMKTAKLRTRKAEEAKRNKIDRIYNCYNDSSTMNYSKAFSGAKLEDLQEFLDNMKTM